MGLYIASSPRIGVLSPGPSNVLSPFQDDERSLLFPRELGRHTEPGEAGTNDYDVDVVEGVACTACNLFRSSGLFILIHARSLRLDN